MAYKKSRWTQDAISFRLIDDATEHPLVTVAADTPDGVVLVMAEPVRNGRWLILKGVHVHAEGVGVNEIGPANLMCLARVAMQRMDLDGLVIEGAIRTTGANRGYAPGRIRFTRRPASGMAG